MVYKNLFIRSITSIFLIMILLFLIFFYENLIKYVSILIYLILFAETLSFFKEFQGIRFIDYSEVKPASCNWADVDEKMPSNNGHYIPQSSCVTKYINDNNYLINYLEKIF